MTRTCCVPGCKSNYESTLSNGGKYVSVFKFPENVELRRKWMQCIPRKDWSPTSKTVVCKKHFQISDVIVSDTFTDKSGTVHVVPRGRPSLKPDAYPTIFPELPGYNSIQVTRSRKHPEDRKNEIVKHEEINITVTTEIKVEIPSPLEHSQTSLELPDSASAGESVSTLSGTSDTSQSLVPGQARGTFTGDIKVEIPSPLEHSQTSLELPDSASEGESVSTVSAVSDTSDTSQSLAPGQATENSKTSLESPDSASGGESVSTVSGTSDMSQSQAPGQARGTYYCPQCSTELPHRNMLYKHFINAHTNGSSKKNHASADICAEYNDKSVNKGGCREGVSDDINNEGNQKQTRSCTAEKSHKPDVCSTGCVNVGQLQARKHEQTCGTCARRISVLTEVSSQKLIQESNDMLTDDNLHSVNGNSNEPLQERISANEINCEICVRNKCHTVCGQKTFCICKVKKTYKCEFCDAQFSQSSHLKAHSSKHTGVKPFHCNVCGVGFTVKCNMNIHMRKHTGEKPYVCEYCGVMFVNRWQLKFHTTSHTGEKPYRCDVCMLGFNHAYSLQAHMVKHTGVKPFHCEVCGVGFTVKSHVHIHMRKHTGEKPYACEDCGTRFVNRRQLKVHRISHTGEKPYKCDVCGAGFNQAHGLHLHKRKHSGGEPYKCGKGYKQYVCKNGYKPYVCEICGLHFSSNSAVQHHKRRHTGEKPHKCDVCGVAFAMKTSLINHQRKHTGETPYSCDVCGLRFSVFTSLKNHQRKHTGEKPYLCDICGMEFAFRGSLQDHKRLHTGEKPYKCVLCFANFSNREKLRRHKKVHTNKNL